MSYWQTIHKNLNKEFDDDEILEENKTNTTKFSNEHSETLSTLQELVEPIGNFTVKESSKQRKFSSLLGESQKVHKNEIVEQPQSLQDKPLSELEKWNKNRETLQVFSERDRKVAMKRDELPEYDEDGYRFTPETPTFRHGFNPTLRIKPTQNPDLHNGKIVNIQGREQLREKFQDSPTLQKGKKSEKSFKHIEILKEDLKAESSQVNKFQYTKENLNNVRHNAHETAKKPMMKLMKTQDMYIPPNKRSLRKSLLKRDNVNKTLALLVLKAMADYDVGINPEQRESILHTMKSGEIVLEELGKAFIELGFVLSPELREESKRTEYKGKISDIGKKIMLDLNTRGDAPNIETSIKNDLVLAVARTFENLKTLNVPEQNGRNIGTPEIETTRRKNQFRKGNLAFEIIERVSSRVEQKGSSSMFRKEEILTEVPKQGEAPIQINSQMLNSNKSIWDGFAKEEYVNDRSLLPSRPNYL